MNYPSVMQSAFDTAGTSSAQHYSSPSSPDIPYLTLIILLVTFQ